VSSQLGSYALFEASQRALPVMANVLLTSLSGTILQGKPINIFTLASAPYKGDKEMFWITARYAF